MHICMLVKSRLLQLFQMMYESSVIPFLEENKHIHHSMMDKYLQISRSSKYFILLHSNLVIFSKYEHLDN